MIVPGVRRGRVSSAMADSVAASLPLARVGEGVAIVTRAGARIPAVVSRVDGAEVSLVAFAPLEGVSVGDGVESSADVLRLGLGVELLGRAVDADARPIDGRGPIAGRQVAIVDPPISASRRAPIAEPLWTGIRAIDALLTIGRGARIGIFGPPAAGKSTLIEMLVRSAVADAVVVALIGERGREAAEWLQTIRPQTTLVVAPLDCSAAERVRGAQVALAQGAQLRRRGLNVLVILDSLARFAAAARELAVSKGESVGRGGYSPSVFAEMARLLERGGNAHGGSLTLIATVLSDGPEENDPLSESARAALDGHIVLSRTLAQSGHYPAIDIALSASRTMTAVISAEHRAAARRVRAAIVLLAETREIRELGFRPDNPLLDRALSVEARLRDFVQQDERGTAPERTLEQLYALGKELDIR